MGLKTWVAGGLTTLTMAVVYQNCGGGFSTLNVDSEGQLSSVSNGTSGLSGEGVAAVACEGAPATGITANGISPLPGSSSQVATLLNFAGQESVVLEASSQCLSTTAYQGSTGKCAPVPTPVPGASATPIACTSGSSYSLLTITLKCATQSNASSCSFSAGTVFDYSQLTSIENASISLTYTPDSCNTSEFGSYTVPVTSGSGTLTVGTFSGPSAGGQISVQLANVVLKAASPSASPQEVTLSGTFNATIKTATTCTP